MSVEVGSKAPDLTLMNQDREPVTLSTLAQRGPVVVTFFPAAFSSTCTEGLGAFRDRMPAFEAAHAQVVGISVDTFFTLKAFADAHHLGFPLLSDFNKEAIRAFDVFNPDMIGLKGIAKRAVFVLDRQLVVRYREVLEDARHDLDYAKVEAAVAAL
jgi:glutaredoxin-dependent peroxiredoxin